MTTRDQEPLDDLLDLGLVTAFGMSGGRSASAHTPAASTLEAETSRDTFADLPDKVGKYDVIELVAQGGMGLVVRGHDRELDRDVAIKFLRRSLSANPAIQRLFRDEARVMGVMRSDLLAMGGRVGPAKVVE